MQYDQYLIVGGWMFAFFCAGLIIVPYLMGRRDLFLPSNFFIAGSGLFVGISAVRSGLGPHYLTYSKDEYQLLFVGFFVFYLTMFLVYSFWKLPRRLAGKMMRKWPPITASSMLFMSIFTTVASALALFPIPIPFVRQLLFHVLLHCGPFALAFALAAVYLDRANPICWLNFLAVAVATIILSMSFGGGRRLLVGAVMTIPVYVYWAWLRYKFRFYVVGLMAVCVVAGMVFLEGFSLVRHRRTGESGVERAVNSARMVAEKVTEVELASMDKLLKLAQPGVEVALLAIHTFVGNERAEEGSLFQGPITILVNPIPREFWKDKPNGLSLRLPRMGREYYGLRGYSRGVTWSINCVAQGYHDGGLIPIMLYGAVAAFALRFFDELMIRQPSNPFLIGMLAACTGHIAGFARGSMDVMSWQLIGCTFSLVFLWIAGRILLGTRTEYPRTDHVESYPTFGVISKWLQHRRTTGR